MYRGLWNFITRYMDNSHAVSVFLPIMISALADLVCAGGYAGLILGLFGGAFFLYRRDV